MEYFQDKWKSSDRVRRDIRDNYRDAFFESSGIKRISDPFDWESDEHENFDHVQKLIDYAIFVHLDDDKSGLDSMKNQIQGNVLGIGGTGLKGTLKYSDRLIERLLGPYFLENP